MGAGLYDFGMDDVFGIARGELDLDVVIFDFESELVVLHVCIFVIIK